MAWRDLLPFGLSGRNQKAFSIHDLAREVGAQGILGNDIDAHRVNREAYKSNPTVAAAVQRIGTAGAQVPWIPQQRQTDGEAVDLPRDHELVALLARPNPWQTWGWVVEAMLGSLVLHGDAYAFLNGPDLGVDARRPGRPPTEILWLPKTQVERVEDQRTGVTTGYVVTGSKGARVQIPAHRVVDAWLWNPESPWRGQSRIQAAAGSIDVANEGRRWNRNVLANAAQPPGFLSTEQSLAPASVDRLKLDMQRNYAGSRNAGKPLIIDAGLKWQGTGMTAVDLQYLEGMREMKRDIATGIGVDSGMMGDPEVKTYANYAEARLSLYQDTVLPLLGYVRCCFELKLRQWWPDVDLFLDTDKVPALLDAKRAAWEGFAGLVERGILTRNEARREMGFDDVPGGDVILVPLSLVPLGDVGVPADGSEEDAEDVAGGPVVRALNGHAKR